jgi:predicted permease
VTSITIDGKTASASHPLRANYNLVSSQHFETLSIHILRGRAFTDQEADSKAPVLVVSESTAQKFWPNQDAIGQRIGIAAVANSATSRGDAAHAELYTAILPAYEVIGIARDTRSGWVWEEDETYLYLPLARDSHVGDYLLVRTESDPAYLMAAVRDEARAVDPHLGVTIRRTADHLDVQMTPFWALALIAGVLGGLALLLASIGLYSVMSFVVTQRTREIGIRIALGAQRGDVVRLFVKEGLRLTAIGIAIGLTGGACLSRLLAAVLLDIGPLDPLAFVAVSLLLALVALVAAYLPARQTTRVDPMAALRRE